MQRRGFLGALMAFVAAPVAATTVPAERTPSIEDFRVVHDFAVFDCSVVEQPTLLQGQLGRIEGFRFITEPYEGWVREWGGQEWEIEHEKALADMKIGLENLERLEQTSWSAARESLVHPRTFYIEVGPDESQILMDALLGGR